MERYDWLSVWGAQNLLTEPEMARFAIAVLERHERVAKAVVITDERNSEGWLEWRLILTYTDGGSLAIGLIQRHRFAAFESHT